MRKVQPVAHPSPRRGSQCRFRLLIAAACVTAAVPASEARAQPREAPFTRAGALRSALDAGSVQLYFRSEAARMHDGTAGGILGDSGLPLQQRSAFQAPAAAESVLLARYHLALQRESRRVSEKDPSLFWGDKLDQDGIPRDSLRREATKIFSGANSRVMSQILEEALRNSSALLRARAYTEGIRFDVLSGGGVKVGGGGSSDEPGQSVSASFGLMVFGRPRAEIRTMLPGGIRTRIELPLDSPGFRATMSRRISANVRGQLSGGVEDRGDDCWVSAGLDLRF